MAQFQGKNVTYRDARAGDAGFDENKDQVWITMDDGSEKIAMRNEMSDAGSPPPRDPPRR